MKTYQFALEEDQLIQLNVWAALQHKSLKDFLLDSAREAARAKGVEKPGFENEKGGCEASAIIRTPIPEGRIDRRDKWFFLVPRRLVVDGRFAGLWSKASSSVKAIVPALMHYASQNGEASVSIKLLSACCGLSEKSIKTAQKNLAELDAEICMDGFNSWGLRQPVYKVPFSRGGGKRQSNMFLMARFLFSTGIWASMKPSEKSLYFAMKGVSICDPDACYDKKTGEFKPELAIGRGVDMCVSQVKDMADLANLSAKSVRAALLSLERKELIVKRHLGFSMSIPKGA